MPRRCPDVALPAAHCAAAARATLMAALLLLALPVAGATGAPSPAAAPSADEAYLDGLLGRWDMAGTVHAKPVRYRARGERVLDGGFLRLHIVDAARKPAYVADVYVGYDAKQHDYIAHWLDRFGAAGARVVASGSRDGARLVIVFPYEEGAFRDTFTWDVAARAWHLLLESQEPGGQWSVFAEFDLRRVGDSGAHRRTAH